MKPLLLKITKWNDYSLVDSGNGRKLERFGPYFFSRPEPQAFWDQRLPSATWNNISGTFITSSFYDGDKTKGKWSLKNALPARWQLSFDKIKFFATPTPFRHLGFFPEQSVHWLWAANQIKISKNTNDKNYCPKILNLFAYSGLASLHAAYHGAEVTHVDASKKAIRFAFENRNLSSFQHYPIKFITDDVLEFVYREIRRNNKYDAIILDPPKYGRGPKGQKWELYLHLPLLLKLLPKILTKNPVFIILNCYAIRNSYLSLHHSLGEVMKDFSGKIESGELSISEDQSNPRQLSMSIFSRWSRNLI